MNSSADLLQRLLKLYPVKIVKGQFDVDSTTQAEQLPEITSKYSEQSIVDFAIDNIGYTKQHTYIYRLDSNFNKTGFVRSSFPLEVKKAFIEGGNFIIICFPIVEYDIALLDPYREVTIQFYQPTRITVNDRTVVVQTTIMEKKPVHYFSADIKAVELRKRNDEDNFIGDILTYFSLSHRVEVCDINRGIKKLWEDDIIDSKHVRFKKATSMTTEAMDEGYTVKVQYPDIYTQITTSPLSKTVFKYLKDDDEFSRLFVADPSLGQLSMAIFPEHPNQTWNVINEILRNN
jgi:hypothetical protein